MKDFTKELKPENIPKDLKDRAQWVAWKSKLRENGKNSKIPVDPKTGKNASHSDPNTWRTFEQASEYYKKNKNNGISGLGYVFSEDDHFVGIDLDNCRDLETGGLKQFAQDVIKSMDSYTEISPSGKGVHIFVKGKLPLGRRRYDQLGIEIYDDKRYFTVTGCVLGGRNAIHDRQVEIENLMENVFSQLTENEETPIQQNSDTADQPCLSDEIVIEKASSSKNGEKFKRLWEGDLSDYDNNHSGGDSALCFHLAFWTGKNPIQMDRLFRKSGLMRPKWDIVHSADGKTYGKITIQKAINKVEGTFQNQSLSFHLERIKNTSNEKELSSNDILSACKANQDGDAALYTYQNRNFLCYDHSSGTWFEFKNHQWVKDKLNNAIVAVQRVIDIYADESKRLGMLYIESLKKNDKEKSGRYDKDQKCLVKRIKELQFINRKQAVINLACAGDNGLGITGEEWDQKPMLFPCGNGVIDLEKGKLTKGKPEQYLKTASPINYIENAEDPALFIKFLNDVFTGNQEIINYIHRLLGYCLLGRVRDHIFPILYGTGRNGKGTLLQSLSHVLGPFAGPIKSSLLLDQGRTRSSAAPNPDILDLRGKRFVWASETKDGAKIDSAVVKWLVGGDILVGRQMYGKHEIRFAPSHTLFLMTNHKPQMPSGDEDFAFWQRVHLIPFKVAFIENPKVKFQRKIDKDLPEKLKAEAEGILAWMVRGCLEYQKQGLNPPEEVRAATKQYQQDEDILSRFIDECCARDPQEEVKSGELFKAFKEWCIEYEYRAVSHKIFGEKMKERFDWKRSDGIKYIGLRLE